MERRVKGLALLLFSILLALFFELRGWGYFDLLFLEVPFAAVYLLVGAAGLALALLPENKEK